MEAAFTGGITVLLAAFAALVALKPGASKSRISRQDHQRSVPVTLVRQVRGQRELERS